MKICRTCYRCGYAIVQDKEDDSDWYSVKLKALGWASSEARTSLYSICPQCADELRTWLYASKMKVRRQT